MISDKTDLIFQFKKGQWRDWIFRFLSENTSHTLDEEEQGFVVGVENGVTPAYIRGTINGHPVLAVGRVHPVAGTRSLSDLLPNMSTDQKYIQAVQTLFRTLLKNRLVLEDIDNSGNIVVGTYKGKFAAWVVDADLLSKWDGSIDELKNLYLKRIQKKSNWPSGRIKTRIVYLLKNWKDNAMNIESNGGIDLTPVPMNVQIKTGSPLSDNNIEGIKFHLDPAMLAQLENTPGFVPVIINIEPMTDLRKFLGIT